MCLYLAADQSVDQLFKKGQHKRTFWKVVGSNRRSIYMDYEYKPGKNKSTRESKELYPNDINNGTVNSGIHVFTSRKQAELEYLRALAELEYLRALEVILPVVCYKKDFIAIGSNNEAVFMNVYVEPRTYLRVFGKTT